MATTIPNKPPKTPKSKFAVKTCDGSGTGEKVILYGESGIGKSTLAMMAPNPVFLCLDDGIRKLRHPVTNEPAQFIEGVKTFQDLLDVLSPQNFGLYKDADTVVLDTATKAQELCPDWMYENIPHEKGQHVSRLEDYGFGKGYQHIVDTMMQLLSRLDNLQVKGKNLIVLAQEGVITRLNPLGEDYMQFGPDLMHTQGKNPKSVRNPWCAWADHVCRIGPLEVTATELQDRSKAQGGYSRGFRFGKACQPADRVVHLRTPGVAMKVKSRTAQDDYVSFREPKDNALWVSVFGEKWNCEGGNDGK